MIPNPFSLLGLLTSGVFVVLGAYVLNLRQRSTHNRLFSLLCGAFSVWALGFSLLVVAPDEETVWFWYRVSSVGWLAAPPMLFHFFHSLTRPASTTRPPSRLLLLYLPAAVLFLVGLEAKIFAVDFVMTPYGWDEILSLRNPWMLLYTLYYTSCAGSGLYFVYRWGRTSVFEREQRQAWVVLWTGVVTLVLATVANIGLRVAEIHHFPGVAPVLMVVWGVAILYAIERYGLMTLNPALAAPQILDAMADSLVIVDSNKVIVTANQSAIKALGGDKRALIGRNLAEILPGAELLAGDRLFELLADAPLRNHPVTVGCADRPRYLTVSAVALRDQVGQPMGAVVLLHDITEFRRAEARAAQADRMATVGMLASGVAHEINNPMTYVLYNLECIATDLPRIAGEIEAQGADRQADPGEWGGRNRAGAAPGELRELAELAGDALDGARRIREIVRELGSFSHTGEERKKLVSLNEILKTATNMAHHQLKFRARLVTDYGDVPPVLANDGRLAQVFLNLLVNATHAIEEGDVNSNEIAVRTWSVEGKVHAEVRDTGKGIPEENLNRIFEPFFTTKDRGAGSGLGLSICHNIVRSHGGDIVVKSQPGKGTRFVVSLPVGEPGHKYASNTPLQATSRRRSRGRILIVDDEPFVARALGRVLCDHEVTLAESGARAIELLEADAAFDAVLCDLMMPEVAGMDLYAWVARSAPELTDGMVFITGGTFTSRAKRFLEDLPNPVMEKPVDPHELKALMNRLVSRRRETARSERAKGPSEALRAG